MSVIDTSALRRGGRRTKLGLALTFALALCMIAAGMYGIGQFAISGYDDESGFEVVHDLRKELDALSVGEMALVSELDMNGRDRLEHTAEELLLSAWYRVLYSGETGSDIPRMNEARRGEFLQGLISGLPAEERGKYSPAAQALHWLMAGETPEGQPAFEALITTLAGLQPDGGQAVSKELKAAIEQMQPQVLALLAEDTELIFNEGIMTRKITRFADNGKGLLSLVNSLHKALAAYGEKASFQGLPRLLMDAGSAPENLPHNPSDDINGAKSVLDAITHEDTNGVKMLAAAKGYYEALKAAAAEGERPGYEGLLDVLLDVSSEEARVELTAKRASLRAAHYNELLSPLYARTLQSAADISLDAGDSRLISLLESVEQGTSLPDAQKALIEELADLRNRLNADVAADFSASLPDAQRLGAQLKMLRVFYALEGAGEAEKYNQGMQPETRQGLRAQLLNDLSGGEPEISRFADYIEQGGETGRNERVMRLFLALGSDEGTLLPAALQGTFKQAIRQNAPRVQAAQAAVRGETNAFLQFIFARSKVILLLGVLLLIDVLALFLLMASQKSWGMNIQWLVILVIVDLLLVFQLLPMIHLVIKAFTPDGYFSLVTFRRLYEYKMNWDALTNTVVAGLATMVLGTLIAFPLAWLVGRTNLYGKTFFRRLFVLTYMVPPYVGAMAWLRLLNPNVGIINQVLRDIFGLTGTVGPLNIYTLPGMIWVLTCFYFPYAFITISRAMEKMDPSLEEASRISGASPLLTVGKITLPMMTPSLIAGALLVFVSAASCYGIPSIIGAPGKVHTVTTRIIEYYGRGTQGLNDATGLAVFLMLMALVILYSSDFLLARKQYITVSGKSTRPNIVDLRSWRVPMTILISLVAVVVVLIPFATILTTSFKIDVGKSMWSPGNFTWGQWENIFTRGETLSSLTNSLIFAAAAATIGILIACTMSYLLQRTRIKGRRIPDFLITLGSGTPSVVIALGLIMTMQGSYGVNIYNTAYILIVAYLVKYQLMGMRTVVSAMSQIHVSLEESSTISGANWLKTMTKITGPLIFPSIAAGWFLIFIPCFYELSMTTLLYSNTTKTIGFQLYEYWTYTSQPQACAMAFGILMVVVLLNTLLNRITRGEFSI